MYDHPFFRMVSYLINGCLYRRKVTRSILRYRQFKSIVRGLCCHSISQKEDAQSQQNIPYIHNYILLFYRSEEHTSELQSRENLVCRLLLEKKKKKKLLSP